MMNLVENNDRAHRRTDLFPNTDEACHIQASERLLNLLLPVSDICVNTDPCNDYDVFYVRV